VSRRRLGVDGGDLRLDLGDDLGTLGLRQSLDFDLKLGR
jgi:hypothetical protein